MHPLSSNDPLAQLVEHNTFNVGVLGSNPKRITSRRESAMVLFFCFGICIGTVTSEMIAVISILITTENLTDALAHYLHITMVYEQNTAKSCLPDSLSTALEKLFENFIFIDHISSQMLPVRPH